MGEVVPHAAAAFHELHLLLVDFYDAAVGVGASFKPDYEAVGERAYLEIVADTGHRGTLRHDVAEIAQQLESLVGAHGVGVFGLDAGNLAGHAAVHVVGSQLVEVAERVLERIFAGPYARGQFVAFEIFQRCSFRFVVGKMFLFVFHRVVCRMILVVKVNCEMVILVHFVLLLINVKRIISVF